MTTLLAANAAVLWRALLTTAALAGVTLVASNAIGLLCGTLAVSSGPLLRQVVRSYVELLRAVPLVVNVFVVFFLAPLAGLELTPFAAVSLSLSLWSGAYVAEIVRGGLRGVPREQTQAATALGLRPWQVFLLVIYPQALRTTLPALVGQVVLLVQSTTLGALVGVPEFLKVAQLIVERTTVAEGRSPAFGVYGFVLAVFFALCSVLTWVARRIEHRMVTEASKN